MLSGCSKQTQKMKLLNNPGRWIYSNEVWQDRSYAKEEKQGEISDKERGDNKNRQRIFSLFLIGKRDKYTLQFWYLEQIYQHKKVVHIYPCRRINDTYLPLLLLTDVHHLNLKKIKTSFKFKKCHMALKNYFTPHDPNQTPT